MSQAGEGAEVNRRREPDERGCSVLSLEDIQIRSQRPRLLVQSRTCQAAPPARFDTVHERLKSGNHLGGSKGAVPGAGSGLVGSYQPGRSCIAAANANRARPVGVRWADARICWARCNFPIGALVERPHPTAQNPADRQSAREARGEQLRQAGADEPSQGASDCDRPPGCAIPMH